MKPIFFETPAEFRRWLERNHDKAAELLVGFYKKDSGRRSITWPESVDEALCFGWIDGVRKRIDDVSYTIRFTPRKRGSNWSAVNIRRVGELTKLGLMQPAGLKAFEARTAEKSAAGVVDRRLRSRAAARGVHAGEARKEMKWFWRRPAGFVYVADVDDDPMRLAAAGATVRLQAAAEQLAAYAKYTRAVAVRVIAEEPVWRLFGAHGEAVCRILERARTITVDDVAMLEHAVRDEAREAYSRAWNRWLGDAHDHTATLAAGDLRSPIGAGFTVLHNLIVERARTLTGGAALTTDDDGDPVLRPDWSAASDAFLHLAMACGAPQLVTPEDAELLTAPWTAK